MHAQRTILRTVIPVMLPMLVSSLVAVSVWGQSVANQRPAELQDVDIVENLNGILPLEMRFVDASGTEVELASFFEDGKPVILTLNYYRCPMLCTYQLNGLVQGLKEVDFNPGDDYQIVTISIDPEEGPDLATMKKNGYAKSLKRDGAEEGWSFLVSPDDSVKSLAKTVGYGYRWNEERGEWAHGSAIFIITPSGRISRYLYGIEYDPSDLRLALLEAGEGRIGSTIDQFILWCFHYDDKTGQYTPHVMNIMRLCGGITVVVLGTGLLVLWRRGDRNRAADARSVVPNSAGLSTSMADPRNAA